MPREVFLMTSIRKFKRTSRRREMSRKRKYRKCDLTSI